MQNSSHCNHTNIPHPMKEPLLRNENSKIKYHINFLDEAFHVLAKIQMQRMRDNEVVKLLDSDAKRHI